MKFVIWGAGILGRRMLQILQAQKCSVEAIIDVDSRKIGLRIGDTPIISFDSYKKHYKKCLIIIATNSLADINIIRKCLERNGIYTYVSMLDNPSEILSGSFYKLPFNEMLKTVHFDSSNSHISLWGLNVFALLLYQYIKQFTRFSCSLINLNWNVQMLELLREEYHILDRKDIDQFRMKILFTSRSQSMGVVEKLNINGNMFYDFSNLKRYENERLKELCIPVVKHRRCFICLTGPSLQVQDLELLYQHKEISFAVNRSYLIFNRTHWRPNYYVVSDRGVLESDMEDYIQLSCNVKLFSDYAEKFWRENKECIIHDKTIYKYHLIYNGYGKEGPEFAKNICNGVYYGGSVAYDCIQLACMIGYREIYLIGADFCKNNNGIENGNHFLENYDSKNFSSLNKKHKGFDSLFYAYQAARKYAEENGIKIYNATRGGALEIFERVDFDGLF